MAFRSLVLLLCIQSCLAFTLKLHNDNGKVEDFIPIVPCSNAQVHPEIDFANTCWEGNASVVVPQPVPVEVGTVNMTMKFDTWNIANFSGTAIEEVNGSSGLEALSTPAHTEPWYMQQNINGLKKGNENGIQSTEYCQNEKYFKAMFRQAKPPYAATAIALKQQPCTSNKATDALNIHKAEGARALNIHKADECQCLNWKETYATGLAKCGHGFELTRALGYPEGDYGTPEEWLQVVKDDEELMSLQETFGNEYCESFYKRFDDTKCARTAMDSSPTDWWGKSWCYVSPECQSAMATGSEKVSAKLCEEGKDSLLSDMDPEALIAYGKKMNFSVPGYFVKVAYPVDRSFFYDNATQEQIETLKASGKTVLVDKVDEHQTKMMIKGGKVYAITDSYEDFSCVEGCA